MIRLPGLLPPSSNTRISDHAAIQIHYSLRPFPLLYTHYSHPYTSSFSCSSSNILTTCSNSNSESLNSNSQVICTYLRQYIYLSPKLHLHLRDLSIQYWLGNGYNQFRTRVRRCLGLGLIMNEKEVKEPERSTTRMEAMDMYTSNPQTSGVARIVCLDC